MGPLPLTSLKSPSPRASSSAPANRPEVVTLMRGLRGKIRYWAESDGAYPARFSLPK